MATSAIAAVLLLLAAPGVQGGEPMIEVEFEPVGGMGDDSEALLGLLNGQLNGIIDGPGMMAGGPRGSPLLQQGGGGGGNQASTHHREDEMDKAIEAMFGSMLSSVGKPGPQLLRGGKPIGGGGHQSHHGPRPEDILFGGPNIIMEEIPFGRPSHGRKDAMPVDLFKDLFPGPLIIEEGPSSLHSFGGGPDPLIMDMLSDLHSGFQEDMLPMLHSAAAAKRAPNTCHQDLQVHCSTARSQLHCLGQHQEDISKECLKDVGKSVPFVCNEAIDKYCDVLSGGILPCLTAQMPNLAVNCKDSVLATQGVITKANTQKVSVVDKTTGLKKTVDPPPSKDLMDMVRQRTAQLSALSASTATAASSSSRSTFLLFGVCCLAFFFYRWPVAVLGSKKAYTNWFKAFGLRADEKEGSQPLRGVELPKPTELFLA